MVCFFFRICSSEQESKSLTNKTTLTVMLYLAAYKQTLGKKLHLLLGLDVKHSCSPPPSLFLGTQADNKNRPREGNLTKKKKKKEKLAQKVNRGCKSKQRKEGVGRGGGRKWRRELGRGEKVVVVGGTLKLSEDKLQ